MPRAAGLAHDRPHGWAEEVLDACGGAAEMIARDEAHGLSFSRFTVSAVDALVCDPHLI